MTTAAKKLLGQFVRLTDKEKSDFLNGIYSVDSTIVAYTTLGKALTVEDYIREIQFAIDQVDRGEVIGYEDLKKEMATW